MQTVFSSESPSSLSAPVLMMFGRLVISPHATVVAEIPHIPDLPHLTHLPHVTKITFSFSHLMESKVSTADGCTLFSTCNMF